MEEWDKFFNEVIIRKDKKGGTDYYRTMPIRFVFVDNRFLVRYYSEFEDSFLLATNEPNFSKHEFMLLRDALIQSQPVFKKIKLSEGEFVPKEFRMEDQVINILCKLPNDTYAVKFEDNNIYGNGISLVECSDIHNKNNKIVELCDLEPIDPNTIYKTMVRSDPSLMIFMNPRQILREFRNYDINVVMVVRNASDLDMPEEKFAAREAKNEKYFYTLTGYNLGKYLKRLDMKGKVGSYHENKTEVYSYKPKELK